jgi:hypothetical protein
MLPNRLILLAGFCVASAGCLAARAEEGVTETTVAAEDAGLSELVTALVRANLPHDYEKKKNWDQTKEVFDGWHVTRDGLRLKTKRKTKAVNHGTWTLYRVKLTRPDEFTIRISNIRTLADGRAAFDAEIAAPLAVFGRLSQWNYGVQLVSLSADCDARVRLQTSVAVRLSLISDKDKLVPDVQLQPEVLDAKLLLDEFRLKSLSQLHGSWAKHLGEEARGVIEDELAERNAAITTKLNQQIAKKKDKLRLSLADLAKSKWGDLTAWVK